MSGRIIIYPVRIREVPCDVDGLARSESCRRCARVICTGGRDAVTERSLAAADLHGTPQGPPVRTLSRKS